ncbi:MAG TPA: cation:proton antiporter [Candidatus Binataceae bacterium]|nr:cation:proton antiporter [Candidatus Binataceae bacterium]
MIIAAHNILEARGLVLCVAAVTTVIRQKIRQPVVVGDLLAGIIVGPYTPLLFANPDRIHTLSELGVILNVLLVDFVHHVYVGAEANLAWQDRQYR